MRISDWSSDVCSSDLQGRSPASAHYARLILLALFGLAHFYLIWFGDILFLYAMCGLLLFLFRNLSIRALLWWAAGFLLLDFALFFGLWSGLVAAASGAAPDMRDALTQIHEEMGADSPTYAQQVALHLGRYADLLA